MTGNVQAEAQLWGPSLCRSLCDRCLLEPRATSVPPGPSTEVLAAKLLSDGAPELFLAWEPFIISKDMPFPVLCSQNQNRTKNFPVWYRFWKQNSKTPCQFPVVPSAHFPGPYPPPRIGSGTISTKVVIKISFKSINKETPSFWYPEPHLSSLWTGAWTHS